MSKICKRSIEATNFKNNFYKVMTASGKNKQELAVELCVSPSMISKLLTESSYNEKKGYIAHVAEVRKDKFIEIYQKYGVTFTYNDNVYVDDFLNESSGYTSRHIAMASHADINMGTETKKLDVIDLLYKIRNNGIDEDKIDLAIQGTLFPALLLCPGWWDRKLDNYKFDLDGCNDLQTWLFTGFEQWAPSWEVSLEFEKPWLIAQLAGHNQDESDSISLIVDQHNAKEIRENFYNEKAPFTVDVTGTLFQVDDFPEDIVLDNVERSMIKNYCIVVKKENKSHGIKILEKSRFYTGYLWQCCIPKQRYEELKEANENPDIKISDVYFIWEHTNYGTKESLEYNLHALNNKKTFIEKTISDELLVVQKSSIIVESGDLILPKDKFFYSICNQIIKNGR